MTVNVGAANPGRRSEDRWRSIRNTDRVNVATCCHAPDGRFAFRASNANRSAHRLMGTNDDRHSPAANHRRTGHRCTAGSTAARRLHPVKHERRLRSSNLEHVSSRCARGARRPPSSLRLGPARSRRERSPHLLQGPRVTPAVLRLQGGGSGVRRGADRRLPAPWIPPARPSHPGTAMGRRRHRVTGTRPPRRRRRRAGRQVPRSSAVPGMGAVWRQRAGRGLDLGGAGQSQSLRTLESRRHRRRQPTRSARADRTGLGSRRLRAPGQRLWGARTRGRRARSGGPGRRVDDGRRDGHATHCDPRPNHQRPRLLRGGKSRGLARQAVSRGHGSTGDRRARWREQPHRARAVARQQLAERRPRA